MKWAMFHSVLIRPTTTDERDVRCAAGPGRLHMKWAMFCCDIEPIPRRIDGTAAGGVIHALSMAPVPDAEEARWAKGG